MRTGCLDLHRPEWRRDLVVVTRSGDDREVLVKALSWLPRSFRRAVQKTRRFGRDDNELADIW